MHLHDHRFITSDDECYFLGEYTARKGFSHSETNDKIISLKMKPSIQYSSPARFKYKRRAIEYWGRMLAGALPVDEAQKAIWVPIPGSCPIGDPEFDDRLVQIIEYAYKGGVTIASPFRQKSLRVAAHDSHERPDSETLVSEWTFDVSTISSEAGQIIIFDDVMVRGASFKAAKDLLKAHAVNATIRGVFLARNIHDDPPILFDMLDVFE
ncbi:phosphoribosyltransferase [Candidatus Phyllobacterium onerii]|uniref:phosphoribosyltransferase n=1 Tax=Candidatus Phyllobacterium onerii TaxID=3020828 RepID=UPI00232B4279|nr:phosphoribosyltransferase [Phyllobacterium sp. IY22]